MKELYALFNEINTIIEDTHFLNSGKSNLSIRLKIIKKICQCAIEAHKRILKTNIKYRLLEKQEVNIQQNKEKEKTEIEQIEQSLSTKTRIIMGIILRKRLVPFLTSEAMYELKYISQLNIGVIEPDLEIIRTRLFDFDKFDRVLYAKSLCRDLDSRLYSTFDNIRLLEKMGWEKYYFVNSINDCLISIFELFAMFDIDLLPIIKKNSDFEKDFGTYDFLQSDKFRNEDFAAQKEKFIEGDVKYDIPINMPIKRGRKSKEPLSFLLCKENDKNILLSKLHDLIDGKDSNVDICLILRAAIEGGKITKPTYKQAKSEFPKIGNESSYNAQMNKPTDKDTLRIKENYFN